MGTSRKTLARSRRLRDTRGVPVNRKLVALAWTVVLACDAPPVADEQRAAELCTNVALDNLVWAQREPALVRGKLALMAGHPYAWFRGSLAVFFHDIAAGRAGASAFVSAAAAQVMLVGDPHVENVGTVQGPGGQVFVAWNDFDAAGYGPYVYDVWRLALSLRIAAEADVPGLIAAMAQAYADEIQALSRGLPIRPVETGEAKLFDKLIKRALRDGPRQTRRDEAAPLVGTTRELREGDVEPRDGDVYAYTLVRLTAHEEIGLRTAWAQSALGLHVVKAWRRRLGAGVASYPAMRYYGLLEGPTADPGDDELVELKELRGPARFPGRVAYEIPWWPDNGARWLATTRALQQAQDADPFMATCAVGARLFSVHGRSGYQRGLNADDIAELAQGDAEDRAELLALAASLGRMLARAHGGAPTERGVAGHAVIAPLVARDPSGFVVEVVAASARLHAAQANDQTIMSDPARQACVVDEARM